MKKILSTLAASAMFMGFGASTAAAHDGHELHTDHAIPVQVVRVQLQNQPLISEASANKAVDWATDYWTTLTAGGIEFDHQSEIDGAVSYDLPKNKNWGSDWNKAVSESVASGEIQPIPEGGIRIFMHKITEGGLSTAKANDFSGYDLSVQGDKYTIAHEVGHALGLGHSQDVENFGGESVVRDYGNGWSMMGGGHGLPDGAQLASLGALRQRPASEGTWKVWRLSDYPQAQKGSYSLKWVSKGGVEYGADWRSVGGVLTDEKNTEESNRVLYVYRVDHVGGVRTTNVAKLKPGKAVKIGGLWVEVLKSSATHASVSISE